MNQERETRRQRQERLRIESPTPRVPARGRRRFAPRIVGFVSAALLLATIAGG